MKPTLEHQLEHRQTSDLISQLVELEDAKRLAQALLHVNTDLKGVVHHMILKDMRDSPRF